MEPKDFARVILRRKRTVITAIVVVTMTVLFASMRKTPHYVAECDVLFGVPAYDTTNPAAKPPETWGNLQTNAEIIKSPRMTQEAAKIVGLPANDIKGKLNVTIIPETQVFRFRVLDTESVRAGQICNAYGQAYAESKRREAQTYYERLLRQQLVAQTETYRELHDILRRLEVAQRTGSNEVYELTVDRDTILFERRDNTKAIAQIRNLLKSGIEGGPQLVKPAGEGRREGGDRKRDLFIGIAVGLMLGIGIALVREYLDDTVKDKESAQRELGVPVLAAMPSDELEDPFGDSASSATLEAARTLRQALASLGFPHERSVLVVTSTLAKRRATTLVALATAVAESGRTVLVVGSDLRGARTHEAFGIANTAGLANVVRGQVPIEKAIRPAPGLDGVYVLPCGPVIGNPGELLSSEEMAMTLRRARRWADVVLLDAPPVLAAADASVLGAYADGVLLVVSAGQTHRSQANEAKEQLVAAGARVLGAVLVGDDPAQRGGTSDGGYGGDLPALVPFGAWSDPYEGGWDEPFTAVARMEPRARTQRTAPKKISAERARPRRPKPEPRIAKPEPRRLAGARPNGRSNGRARSTRTTAVKRTTTRRSR